MPLRLLRPLLRRLIIGISLLPALAFATSFNVSDAQRHAHWQSMTLTLGDERHFRAVEDHSYTDATLSVNATRDVCDLPWLEMRVTLEEHQGNSDTLNVVPALVRVDDGEIRQAVAEFITQRGDDGFYAHFYINALDTVLTDMREGAQFFLAFEMSTSEQDEREPWHMTFSLDGADAALTRMQTACYSDSVSTGPGRENQ
ncbi:hypothetical protein QC823_06850 [Halomonas vilamensis]|uniref:Uncharacterized protein n=1 Tax=Vreelandella vilamensis TaxID=531309 RepID=A0ABU1H3A6_9GAMM|nr:hypothetical protein [Halomonas vilamensis]MDR5898704.1 hypothetical protein [Halomonas vilamensis]